MRIVGVSDDKRIGKAFKQLEAAIKQNGLPKLAWNNKQFKYLGYLRKGPIFAVAKTVAIVMNGRVEELPE